MSFWEAGVAQHAHWLRYGLDGYRESGLGCQQRQILFLPNAQRGSGAHSGAFPKPSDRAKRPRSAAEHSHPYNKDSGTVPPFPIRHHGMLLN